jgi:hypothetical protein
MTPNATKDDVRQANGAQMERKTVLMEIKLAADLFGKVRFEDITEPWRF